MLRSSLSARCWSVTSRASPSTPATAPFGVEKGLTAELDEDGRPVAAPERQDLRNPPVGQSNQTGEIVGLHHAVREVRIGVELRGPVARHLQDRGTEIFVCERRDQTNAIDHVRHVLGQPAEPLLAVRQIPTVRHGLDGEPEIVCNLLDHADHLRVEVAGSLRTETEDAGDAPIHANRGDGDRAIAARRRDQAQRNIRVGGHVAHDDRPILAKGSGDGPTAPRREVCEEYFFLQVAVHHARGSDGGHERGLAVLEPRPRHPEAADRRGDPARVLKQLVGVVPARHELVDGVRHLESPDEPLDSLLGGPPFAHVANDRHPAALQLLIEPAHAQLHGHLRPIPPQVGRGNDRAIPGLGFRDLGGSRGPILGGLQVVDDMQAGQLAAAVAVELLGPSVRLADAKIRAQEEDRVGRMVEEDREAGLVGGEPGLVGGPPRQPESVRDARDPDDQRGQHAELVAHRTAIRSKRLLAVDLDDEAPRSAANAAGDGEHAHPPVVDEFSELAASLDRRLRGAKCGAWKAEGQRPVRTMPQGTQKENVAAVGSDQHGLHRHRKGGLGAEQGVEDLLGVGAEDDGAQEAAPGPVPQGSGRRSTPRPCRRAIDGAPPPVSPLRAAGEIAQKRRVRRGCSPESTTGLYRPDRRPIPHRILRRARHSRESQKHVPVAPRPLRPPGSWRARRPSERKPPPACRRGRRPASVRLRLDDRPPSPTAGPATARSSRRARGAGPRQRKRQGRRSARHKAQPRPPAAVAVKCAGLPSHAWRYRFGQRTCPAPEHKGA